MQFHDKLDFLMNLTNVSNSALARHTLLDASYISRLRRGARKPAQQENYLLTMAGYFAAHCAAVYQQEALAKAMEQPLAQMGDKALLTDMIHQWLQTGSPEAADPVAGFLEGFSSFRFKKPPGSEVITAKEGEGGLSARARDTVDPKTGTQLFYDTEGKREAVLAFLDLVLARETPQTLLLFSDENLDWLKDQPTFTARWAQRLAQVVLKGNRIKIIHTISRDIDEMLSAIGEWLPIYMTGAIEPYYYPRIRDGIFRRTLFIAPGTAAVCATSVGEGTRGAVNFLVREPQAVAGLVAEFQGYAALCRPLMRIFTPGSGDAYVATLTEFEAEAAHAMIKTDTLSLTTMPQEVAALICTRLALPEREKLLADHAMRTRHFSRQLETNTFHELINLPRVEDLSAGKIRIGAIDLTGGLEAFYTPEEYRLHLMQIIELLNTHERYHVSLGYQRRAGGYTLYAREDVGVLVMKPSQPPAVFAINEGQMTASFWDYLMHEALRADEPHTQRRQVVEALKTMIRQIESSPANR
ncbi:hypothetical protein SAMN06296020_10436 [Anoxynatronum buryatiense]|uniref:Uncharacterized protein n=1 Tax=Anoxynatronum buryatiense TaxID=489973 RepID=A0AA45WV26_9CLOT|nr:hypothetical protein SAMN06296020_10436 [Anoxynatronum buryatiense]